MFSLKITLIRKGKNHLYSRKEKRQVTFSSKRKCELIATKKLVDEKRNNLSDEKLDQ